MIRTALVTIRFRDSACSLLDFLARSSAKPMMAVRGLLISWAMPAANWPMDASLAEWMSIWRSDKRKWKSYFDERGVISIQNRKKAANELGVNRTKMKWGEKVPVIEHSYYNGDEAEYFTEQFCYWVFGDRGLMSRKSRAFFQKWEKEGDRGV